MSEMNQEAIYFDYRITGQEEYDKLTVLVQFRYGDADGPAILLEAPAKVELDGETFPADSSALITGTFYELHKPISAFEGKHRIVFTNFEKKQYKEEFKFKPLALVTTIPDTLHHKDLVLELTGLDEEDSVRLLLTDTSRNDGINKITETVNGKFTISKYDLDELTNGPVQLELVMEKERPLKNHTEAGGQLFIIYSLKREFVLRD